MQPLVSIVICCYNRAHLLAQTMASVFAQEYDPVEIIVVDDGSTDNTPELMASYGQKIRYYWQENQGVAITRTNACRLAKGEFIAFQDDDDLMPPDRIVRLYEALCKYPSAVLAVGDWEEIDGEGELIGRRTRFNVHVDNEETVLIKDGYRAILWPELTPTPHTTLFRRIDGERIGWFDTRFFHACEDTDFFARCAQLGPIVYVPKIVSFYRRQQGSLSSNKILLLYSWFLLFEKHLLSIKAEEKDLKQRFRAAFIGFKRPSKRSKITPGAKKLSGICVVCSNQTAAPKNDTGPFLTPKDIEQNEKGSCCEHCDAALQ